MDAAAGRPAYIQVNTGEERRRRRPAGGRRRFVAACRDVHKLPIVG
jgi:hypothetical protein